MLPKTSLLFRFNKHWTSRIGGGLGYKTPTSFTEQTESLYFQNLKPLQNVTSEKSIGATADINFKTKITDDLDFSINQMFFYTKLKNSIVLDADSYGNPFLTNTDKLLHSKGFETNLKIIYKDFLKFFGGYTYTDTKADYLPGNQVVPLVPKNRVNLALVAEREGNYKVGWKATLQTGSIFTTEAGRSPIGNLGLWQKNISENFHCS